MKRPLTIIMLIVLTIVIVGGGCAGNENILSQEYKLAELVHKKKLEAEEKRIYDKAELIVVRFGGLVTKNQSLHEVYVPRWNSYSEQHFDEYYNFLCENLRIRKIVQHGGLKSYTFVSIFSDEALVFEALAEEFSNPEITAYISGNWEKQFIRIYNAAWEVEMKNFKKMREIEVRREVELKERWLERWGINGKK